jgi:putative NADH-flavin reductase
VWPDVSDRETLTAALRGVDVVISTLAGAEKGPTTVCTDAMRSTIPAMNDAGVSRLIVVSAHGVLESHDRSLFSMAVWSAVPDRMRDKETMEHLIVDSPLDWTIVRPPMLKDTVATGRVQVGENLPIKLWHSIGREDLAGFLVDEADERRFVRGYPRIHR